MSATRKHYTRQLAPPVRCPPRRIARPLLLSGGRGARGREENGAWRAIKPQTFDPVIKKRLSEVLLRGEELRRDNDMDLQLSARAFPVVRCDPKLLNEAESAPEVPPPKALLRTACRNLLSESCTASGNAKRE